MFHLEIVNVNAIKSLNGNDPRLNITPAIDVLIDYNRPV